MRADSALSHLSDGELCIAIAKDGSKHEVRWSVSGWCFYYTTTNTVCSFDEIQEWRLASIKF